LNLPNALTLSRMALAPIFILCLLAGGFKAMLAALVIFAGASLTDWVDGHLARSRGAVTDVGKLIDPLADKLLTSLAFIGLVGIGLIPALPVMIIIGRDFLVTSLRALAGDKGVVIAASKLAKWKTAIQMLAIGAALVYLVLIAWGMRTGGAPPLERLHPLWLGSVRALVWVTAGMALISGGRYVVASWPAVRR